MMAEEEEEEEEEGKVDEVDGPVRLADLRGRSSPGYHAPFPAHRESSPDV